jgi:hypothetical protein
MRWRYLRCSRRLLVWDPPTDVAVIRSVIRRRFDVHDVTAIIFYTDPTTIVLRGRFLDRIIWQASHDQILNGNEPGRS